MSYRSLWKGASNGGAVQEPLPRNDEYRMRLMGKAGR